MNGVTTKLTEAATVYRGVPAGGKLPDQFWAKNEHNVRGGIEAAFLSFSLEKQVAVAYSGNDPSNPGIIFEVEMGMIDRGAKLETLSQYEHEKEILCALHIPSSRCAGALTTPSTGSRRSARWRCGDSASIKRACSW